MNLPYPFKSARGLEPDALGRIALIDGDGKVLAHLPLASAHGIAPQSSGYIGAGWGCGDGMGYFGDGMGYGDGYGYGSIFGYGHGYAYGYRAGSGDGDGCGYGNNDGSGGPR